MTATGKIASETLARLRRNARFLLLTLTIGFSATPAIADGTQTGRLVGLVIDTEGVPVQGVAVSLDGPQGRRDAVTDDGGEFRFPALPIAEYRVGAELFELAAAPVAVRVSVDRTSEVRLTLGADDASGTEASEMIRDAIQVSAEAPLVDRFETQIGAAIDAEFLDALPVERFYQSVALLLPGVSGGEDGNPNVSGSLRSANLYLIDGVDTTDPTTGLFGLNLAYDSIDQVEVNTAGLSPEYGRASGAVINVVSRSGGNSYGGRVRWSGGRGSWKENYDVDPATVPHLLDDLAAADATDDLDPTVSFSLRGPIVPRRIFVSAAWETLERSLLRPTAGPENWDEDFRGESGAFKVDVLLSASQSLVLQHTFDDAEVTDFAPFDLRPAENRLPQIPGGSLQDPLFERRPGEIFALDARTQDGEFSKAAWSAVIGSGLTVRASVADQKRELEREARQRRGLTGDAPHAVVFPTSLGPGDDDDLEQLFLANAPGLEGFERRPRRQADVAVDWFHSVAGLDAELTAGFDHQRTESESLLLVPGVDGIDRQTGIPVVGQIFFDFDTRPECLFDGDCNPFDPVSGTFQPFGLLNSYRRPLRTTRQRANAVHLSETISGKRWVLRLGLRWEQVDVEDEAGATSFDDQDFAPRIALTWDALGDGKTLLTAAYSRYHEPILQQVLDAQRIAEPLSGYSLYFWDFETPACWIQDPSDIVSPCWLFEEQIDLFALQAARNAPSLERASVDEIVLGFRREIGASGALSLHWIDRRWNDLWDDVLTLTDDFDVVGVLANLDLAERSHRAARLFYQWRDRTRWQVIASYTWSRTEGHFFTDDGLSTFADFANLTDVNQVNRFGPAPYDRPHAFSLFASRRFPALRGDLILATALQYRDGTPFHRETLVDAGVFFLTPRGDERLDGSFRWDLSARYDLRLPGDLIGELRGEIFNLTDENEQLGAESLVDEGLQGRPRSLGDLQSPRSYRITLGLRF